MVIVWDVTFFLYDQVIEWEYVRSRALYEQVNAHFVPFEQNYELQQITNALIQQSNDELYNISKSLGFMVDRGWGQINMRLTGIPAHVRTMQPGKAGCGPISS